MEVQQCTALDFGLAAARISTMLHEANQADTAFHTAVGHQVYPTFVFSLVRLPAAVAWLVELDSDQLDRAHELAERILLPPKHAKAPIQALVPQQFAVWPERDIMSAVGRVVRGMLGIAERRMERPGWPLAVTPYFGDRDITWFNCASGGNSSHKFAIQLDKMTLRRGADLSSPSSEWELGTRGFMRGLSFNVPHEVVFSCVGSLMWQTQYQQEHYARLRRPHPGPPDGYDEQMAHDVLGLVIMFHIFTKRTDAHLEARRVDGDFRAMLGEIEGTLYDQAQHFAAHGLLPTAPPMRRALAVLENGLPPGHSDRERAELARDVEAALAWCRLKFHAFDDDLDQQPRRGLADHSLGSAHSRARRDGRRLAASRSRF
ncbi:hypothetical protein JCM9279_003072 [Rhodotorula babjevae]